MGISANINCEDACTFFKDAMPTIARIALAPKLAVVEKHILLD